MIGVIIASFSEIKFVLSGFLFAMAGQFFEAYRLALIQRLLSSDEYQMDPLVSLYHFAPICAVLIFALALVTEVPRLEVQDILDVGIWTLGANAATAFLLNVSSVFLVGLTEISREYLTNVISHYRSAGHHRSSSLFAAF